MKKLGLLVMPLMAVSFLTSCNNDKPTPKEYTLSITLDHCKIGDTTTTYTKKYTEGAIIDAVTVTPNDTYVLNENSVPSKYKDYWKESSTAGTWTFSNLKMNENHEFTISATELVTLAIELNNCTINGSTTYSKVYPKNSPIEPVTVTANDGLALTLDSVSGEYQQYWTNDDGWKFHDLVMDKSYTITINAGCPIITNNDDITICPNLAIPYQEYEGSIFINDKAKNSKILPLKLDSVMLISPSVGADMVKKCIYEVKDDNKDSFFKMPFAQYITPGDYFEVNLTTKDIATAKWSDYVNWWDYCSKDGTAKAVATDVGTEVNVTVYEKVHKVRLIDVDHKNAEGEDPEAHCTFEFANVITNSNGEAIPTNWDVQDNRKFSKDSTLDKLLNINDDCIFTQLPEGLQIAIKEVDKKVGECERTDYTAKSYKTKLFPLAADEMEEQVCSPEGEGLKYKYYADGGSRIKTPVGSESGESYWLRSPWVDPTCQAYNYAYRVLPNAGGISSIQVTNSNAIAPAFCI